MGGYRYHPHGQSVPEETDGDTAVLAHKAGDEIAQTPLDNGEADPDDGDVESQGHVTPPEAAFGVQHDELVDAFRQLVQEERPGKELETPKTHGLPKHEERIGFPPIDVQSPMARLQTLCHGPGNDNGDA